MPTGTQAGHRPKFRDCPGQTGTLGNYALFLCGSLGPTPHSYALSTIFFASLHQLLHYFAILLLFSISYFDLCLEVVIAILLIDKNLVELLSEVNLYSTNL